MSYAESQVDARLDDIISQYNATPTLALAKEIILRRIISTLPLPLYRDIHAIGLSTSQQQTYQKLMDYHFAHLYCINPQISQSIQTMAERHKLHITGVNLFRDQEAGVFFELVLS